MTDKDIIDEIITELATDHTVYRDCLVQWGIRAQEDQLVEEMAELMVAINQRRRGRIPFEDVTEEIADVFLMLMQMAIAYDGTHVATQIELKRDRIRERLL